MYFNNLRAESDRLCAEHGLSVIENLGKSTGSRYLQQATERDELSGKIKIICRELYCAHDIFARHVDIKRQLRLKQALLARQLQQKRTKNIKERDQTR